MDVTLRDIRYLRKDSNNLHLKGNVFCVEPSRKVDTIPQDGNLYGLVVRNAIDILIENVKFNSVEGDRCHLYIENN